MLRTVKANALARELFLCFICAFLLAASFPLLNFELLAWGSFVPLFFNLQNKSSLKTFLLSFFTGVFFWLGTIYWLIHVTVPGMLLLALYLGLYFGIFGLIFAFALRAQPVFLRVLFVPAAWVLLEYLRSHLLSGFPWALLGYSQYLNLPVIQIADITGAWGVSFLVMMVNVAVYSVLGSRLRSTPSLIGMLGAPLLGSKRAPAQFRLAPGVLGGGEQGKRATGRIPFGAALKEYGVVLLLLALTFGYGYFKLHAAQNNRDSSLLKISVIQGNIPQELKWDIRSRAPIVNKYIELTSAVISRKPDLIIWPEAALPVVPAEEPAYFERVCNFVKEIKTPLLLGAVTLEDEAYYNSALLLSAEGEIRQMYNKLHLVPFGEYIPLRHALPFLAGIVPIGDISPGSQYTVFSLPHLVTENRFSVLICFEDLFPELSREFVRKGARFLVVMTNDAWFGKSSAPYQHCAASVLRAVENRRPVVRSANTGISGFIDPSGKIISLVMDNAGENRFIDGYLTREVAAGARDMSFYARAGDVFVVVCVFIILCGIIMSFRKRSS
ncbi:MAG: apolipoprotein N-acyltransferase [Candidatus Omnitrophota bacterium]